MLNRQEEKFVQGLFDGLSQRNAYLAAFPNSRKWKPATVDSKACTLAKLDKIQGRLSEIQQENANFAALSREKLLVKLKTIIDTTGVKFKGSDIIKALELYVRMCGYEVAPAINPETLDKFAAQFAEIKIIASEHVRESEEK